MPDYQYLRFVPKPLLDDFVQGRVVPFVGAGFSKNAKLPAGQSMPDWNELGKIVAWEIDGYDYEGDPVDVLSYYEEQYTRAKLVELLIRRLNDGVVQPGPAHEAFCALFSSIICTTNFDSLIEDEMKRLHIPVSVVATEDRLTISGERECKVLKLHGDFNHPARMVITERNYDDYLASNPVMATYVASLFINNTMLLVGYSLDDPDFRMIWRLVSSRLGNSSQPAYCIEINASPVKVARFQRRGIRVINILDDKEGYGSVLETLFREIKDHVQRTRDLKVRSTEEDIDEQLTIPAENNRLCFLSCPNTRVARVSAMIRPILNANGVSMLRLDDILAPGDNWTETLETAIRRCRAAIVDVSESNTNVHYEIGALLAAKGQGSVLPICENGTQPSYMAHIQALFYDSDSNGLDMAFSSELSAWIKRVFDSTMSQPFNDGWRLFEKEEYSPSIVSAYSELEYRLRQYGSYDDGHTNIRAPFRLESFIDRYATNTNNDYRRDIQHAREYRMIRNNIVHNRYIATRKEAESFLRFAESLLAQVTSAVQ